ncbi:MAG: LamG domain-containing protein [Candidatus Micrarchaeota archaeon]
MTFAPKAPPGSCQVFRPDGPYTTSFINLEGVCSGELPQYVASFGASAADQIIVNYKYFQGNPFTILAWVYWPPGTNLASPGTTDGDLGYAWSGPATTDEGFGIFSRSDHWYLNFWADDLECSSGPVAGRWYQFGASWNASTKLQTIWVNGAANCTRTSSGTLITNSPLYIGSAAGTWDGSAYMDGLVADIQIYNTSLSASEIQTLYQEGIGGAPIDLQHLVAWWPLNGNANDYSGNGNNGQASNVNFVSNWYSGYTPP